MSKIPSWDMVKAEVKDKWYIVLLCMLAGLYQGLVLLFPGLPNPFKF